MKGEQGDKKTERRTKINTQNRKIPTEKWFTSKFLAKNEIDRNIMECEMRRAEGHTLKHIHIQTRTHSMCLA